MTFNGRYLSPLIMRERRAKLKISQANMANAVDLPTSTYGGIERAGLHWSQSPVIFERIRQYLFQTRRVNQKLSVDERVSEEDRAWQPPSAPVANYQQSNIDMTGVDPYRLCYDDYQQDAPPRIPFWRA